MLQVAPRGLPKTPPRLLVGAALLLVTAASVVTTVLTNPFQPPAAPVAPPQPPAVSSPHVRDRVEPIIEERPRAAALPATDVVAAPTVATQELAPPAPPKPTTSPPASPVSGPPITFFLNGEWVASIRETGLYSEPDFGALRFTTLPEAHSLRVIERRPGWVKAYYLGDHDGRQPGEAWVPADDLAPAARPALWAIPLADSPLWTGASISADQKLRLARGTLVEVTGPLQDQRVLVRFPGDGEALPPGKGWIAVAELQPISAPLPTQLPWAYPYTVEMDVLRIPVPYRSQIDGSSYQFANCGPASISMALAAFGVQASPAELRAQVLDDQQAWGDDMGSNIWALADVVQMHGLQVFDLYDGAPNPDRTGPLRHWSVDDVREQLRRGRVVIPQVFWRALPGREDSDYWGDHFVVITGMVGDAFLYNDPIDRGGLGYDRVMSADTLAAAMNGSSSPGAAFAIGRT